MTVYSGCVAGVIDIGTSWLSDIKEGVCKDAFWLNKEQCCWSSNDTVDTCSQVEIVVVIDDDDGDDDCSQVEIVVVIDDDDGDDDCSQVEIVAVIDDDDDDDDWSI